MLKPCTVVPSMACRRRCGCGFFPFNRRSLSLSLSISFFLFSISGVEMGTRKDIVRLGKTKRIQKHLHRKSIVQQEQTNISLLDNILIAPSNRLAWLAVPSFCLLQIASLFVEVRPAVFDSIRRRVTLKCKKSLIYQESTTCSPLPWQ